MTTEEKVEELVERFSQGCSAKELAKMDTDTVKRLEGNAHALAGWLNALSDALADELRRRRTKTPR